MLYMIELYIKQKRIEKNLTQEQLAGILNCYIKWRGNKNITGRSKKVNVLKDELLDVKRLSKRYSVKGKIIENMITISKYFGYLDREIEILIKEYYSIKK